MAFLPCIYTINDYHIQFDHAKKNLLGFKYPFFLIRNAPRIF